MRPSIISIAIFKTVPSVYFQNRCWENDIQWNIIIHSCSSYLRFYFNCCKSRRGCLYIALVILLFGCKISNELYHEIHREIQCRINNLYREILYMLSRYHKIHHILPRSLSDDVPPATLVNLNKLTREIHRMSTAINTYSELCKI